MMLIAAAAALSVMSSLGLGGAQAGSGDDPNAAEALQPVDVLQVSGILDPILVDEIGDAIDRASKNGSQALILQMNSRSAAVSQAEVEQLASKIKNAPIPVAIWVGPSKARAYGLPGQLLAASPVTAVAPGARIGNFGAPISIDGEPADFGPSSTELINDSMGFDEARDKQVIRLQTNDQGVPGVRNMVLALDGLNYNGTLLETAVEVADENGVVQLTSVVLRFSKLGLIDQLFHTVASVPIAYLLFIIGAALLVFEFFTAGVGVGGVIGAVCLMLGCYGFAVLPTRPIAVALLIASMLAAAIDVQVGVPRLWTTVAMVLFVLGSVFLYRDLRLPWLTLVVGVTGIALTFVVGMPSMVRTRFATPTIGRDWMIGEMANATVAIDPEGLVQMRGATWRARTNRATPIAAGDAVRIVAIDGVTLQVEPESGGARDYRERRPHPVSDSSTPDLTEIAQ